ncbi:MAG: hypothetical protein JWQ72_3007, partial [Polaromonas sp.]|nr:hypothetical protein [Polaromonas sp.]
MTLQHLLKHLAVLCAPALLAGAVLAATPAASKAPPILVQPQAAGAAAQGMFPAASRPKLMKMTLANAEFSPGVVELVANMQSDRTSESCQFTVNVMSNLSGNDVINTQFAGPLTYHFALPAPAQKFPLSTLPKGKYRINVVAVALANPACVGYASADFEVKRKAMNLGSDITGIQVRDDGYDKVNKAWSVGINGKSDEECGYRIRFKHEASGKMTEFTG